MLPGSDRGGLSEVSHLPPELQAQLRQMDMVLRRQWRLGQNIVLCWAPDPRGLLTIVVPHYFLGNFTVGSGDPATKQENEAFIRTVIGGSHLKTHPEIFAIAKRLGVSTSFIKLDRALGDDPAVLAAADAVIARYGIGYTEQRAVLLFDIAEFSLYTPFEQASQLNSLSYSMNSAYNKLQREGVDVNFARTTTGDGYYVWNRDVGAYPDLDLLSFLCIVLMDNAIARREASGNTVPVIRAAYHIGSHYELFQAEGVNPTLFSYIVGDVTIKLARMLDKAGAGQVLLGEFAAELPERRGHFDANHFMRAARDELLSLNNLQVAGQGLKDIQFRDASCGTDTPAELRIVDKHGLEQHALNLHCDVTLGSERFELGKPLV
jgi:hypothetical protein